MPDHLPILQELRDDLATAYAAREAATHEAHDPRGAREPRAVHEPHVGHEPRGPNRRRAPRRALALAAAAAVTFGAVLVALPGDDRSVASVLEEAAQTAAKQPAPAAAPGTFAYFRQRSGNDVTGGPMLAESGSSGGTEWWVARDGSGRVRQTFRLDNDHERPANYPGQPRWRQAGDQRWVRDARFGKGGFDAMHGIIAPSVLEPRVDRLPAEPDALEAALTRQLDAAARDDDPETGFQGGPIRQYQLLTVVEQTLAHPLVSPAVRGGLYRLVATFEGVTVREDAKDPVGRAATVLVHTRDTHPGTVRTEIFFDPRTSASLATRTTTREMGSASTSTRLYTPPTTVDSASARP